MEDFDVGVEDGAVVLVVFKRILVSVLGSYTAVAVCQDL